MDSKMANKAVKVWKPRCPDCQKTPLLPVTGKCGHTRCKGCIETKGACPCGAPPPPQPLVLSIFVQDLLNKMVDVDDNESGQSSSSECSTSSKDRRPSQRSAPDCVPFNHPGHCSSTDPSEMELAAAKNSSSCPLSREVWLQPDCLECIICCNLLDRPIITECGHTFCQTCIISTVRLYGNCPVCRRHLDLMSIVLSSESKFITRIQAALTTIPGRLVFAEGITMFIPIFGTEIVFPTSWAEFVLEPHQTTSLLRILDAGKRRFGIVGVLDGDITNTGTIVDVCNCVCMENGQALVCAIGIARVKISDVENDGANLIAEATVNIDLIPSKVGEVKFLHLLAQEVTDKTLKWIAALKDNGQFHLIEKYGRIPLFFDEQLWWKKRHGPHWLWWIASILHINTLNQLKLLSKSTLQERIKSIITILDELKENA